MNCPKVFLSIDIRSILSSDEPSGVPLNQSILKKKKTRASKYIWKPSFEQEKKSQHVIPTAWWFSQKGKAPFGWKSFNVTKLFAYWIDHSRDIKFSLAARTPIGCNSASNFRAQSNSQLKTLSRSLLRYVSYVNFSGPVSEVSRSPTLKGKTLGGLLGGSIEMKYV